MKKKIIITTLCSSLLAVIVYVGISLGADYYTRNITSLKLSSEFSTFDIILESSPIVIIGTVKSSNDEFVYDEMEFAITQVKVTDSVRGTDKKEKIINILQTKSQEDPFLQKGDKVLLFLSEYEGPITENAYVINGLYQGHFKIKGDNIYKFDKNVKEKKSTENLVEMIKTIKNTKYTPLTEYTDLTPEEIEAQNNAEKEKEKESENN